MVDPKIFNRGCKSPGVQGRSPDEHGRTVSEGGGRGVTNMDEHGWTSSNIASMQRLQCYTIPTVVSWAQHSARPSSPSFPTCGLISSWHFIFLYISNFRNQNVFKAQLTNFFYYCEYKCVRVLTSETEFHGFKFCFLPQTKQRASAHIWGLCFKTTNNSSNRLTFM